VNYFAAKIGYKRNVHKYINTLIFIFIQNHLLYWRKIRIFAAIILKLRQNYEKNLVDYPKPYLHKGISTTDVLSLAREQHDEPL
jgi:hypothetical protein